MSAENAIEVCNLVKDFRVYHRSFGTLKGLTADLFRRTLMKQSAKGYGIRRALDDISFTVPTGQTIALIGRNGSGKSTLLSILSRIYLPTSGEAHLYGNMMSLLELGVGFDLELTGAENVFFSAILRGLTAKQTAERYTAILDFAELDSATMDLPMRMYSNGMQMRLAFGIVAHLNADIILLDEGLAVGDVAFQQKCYAKMADYQREGRTIIMVAQEMPSVRQFASRVLWLDKGKLHMDGPPETVTVAYEAELKVEEDAGEQIS